MLSETLHEPPPTLRLGGEEGSKNIEATQISLRKTITGRKYRARHPQRRRNDLLIALGFLELGNALDFAANVWNQTPPPIVSVVFMALGATGALTLFILGIRDMPRSWRNYMLLRKERKRIHASKEALRAGQMQDTPCRVTEHDLKTHLDVNYREIGNELIDRFLMGLGLGFGALAVAAGTYLAIAGANPRVFLASNILTGYLGNVPAVIYGLLNAAWCVYGWRRAQSHLRAVDNGLPQDPWGPQADIAGDIRRRESHVKTHALVNGIAGILGGVGGLMTATAYIHPDAVWGYLLLIPSILAAIFANVIWRRKINYDRDIVEPVALDAHGILNEAGFAKLTAQAISEFGRESAKPRGWSWRNRHLDLESLAERLQSFLMGYSRLNKQMVAQRSAHLEKAHVIESQQAEQEDADACRTLTLDEKRLLSSRQNEGWDSMASIHPTVVIKNAKPSQPVILINGIVDILSDFNTLPDFLARLANDSITACLVKSAVGAHSTANHAEHDLVMRDFEANPDVAEKVIRIACETLLAEGLEAAKSRARYNLELAGSFLQDR